MELDRVVGHDRLGQAEELLQVEVHLQRQCLLGAAGCPVVRPEPHRDHGGRRDRPAGERVGHLGVPEERVPVLDRGARRPDVAVLDGELAHLVVLLLPEQVEGLRQRVGRGRRRAHATTPRVTHAAMVSPSTPASFKRCSVSVCARVGQRHDGVVPSHARQQRCQLREVLPPSDGCRPDDTAGPRTGGVRPPRPPRAPVPRTCRRRPARRPTVARRGAAKAWPQGGADVGLRAVVVLMARQLRTSEGGTEVGEELGLDGADGHPVPVGRAVGGVTGVAAGEDVVARADVGARRQDARRWRAT